MVRVGGGWCALDEFLVKNDPCRGKKSHNDYKLRLSMTRILPNVDHTDPEVRDKARKEAAHLTKLIIKHARVRKASRDHVPYFSYMSPSGAMKNLQE